MIADTLLEVEELTKDYGPVRAVDHLSFAVQRGEIVGLLGPNGAGKTTAMRVLVGYQVPNAGTVRLAGGHVFREGPRAKRVLGYLPESMPLYPEMRVGEYLEFAGRLHGLRGPELAAALERMGAMLGLQPMWRRSCGQLSRGYRQRVGLAQCLIADPPLLVLDEPTTGLDPNQISDLRHLLEQWRPEKAILLSTHILAEALLLCDRVLILNRGRLVAAASPKEFAGRSERAVETVVTVQGSGHPLEGHSRLSGLVSARPEASGLLWRLEGRLDRPGRLMLVQHLAAGGWDIVEWNAGLSALEQAFRRMTIEESRVATPPEEEGA